MNELQIFKNNEFGEIRTVTVDSEPWFVGKDVAEALGYERGVKAIQDHVDIDDKDEIPIQDSIGRMQKTPIINESGLYSLVISSKLETAKKFKRWVTSDVLPTIRKHGMYATDELLSNPDFAIKVFEELKAEREQRRVLEEQSKVDKPKVLFADAVATSADVILIGALAKIIRQNGVEIGQNRLFQWLRDKGYLIKVGDNYNLPTQRSMEMELFKIKERTITESNGSIKITKTVLVTGKGQQYFINKFLAS